MNVINKNKHTELQKIIKNVSFNISRQEKILAVINQKLHSINNLVVDTNESVITGCRLVPKDNNYSSTVSTKVPTTESDNVLLNTNDTITKIECNNIIEQHTENNIDDKENNYDDTELKDEDFVFSDYKSYNKICNQVIDKYHLELLNFSDVSYWNPEIENFLDNESKSFVKDFDFNISLFNDLVFNELRLLKCYTKDKKIFKDKEKRTKVINKLKMLPEIKKKYRDMWILAIELNWKLDEALMKTHDEKMIMIKKIIYFLANKMLEFKEYNKKLHDTGFFTTFKNNLSKLHPDDYYCKMMGLRFFDKILYKSLKNIYY